MIAQPLAWVLQAAFYRAIIVFLISATAVIMLALAENAGLTRLAAGLVARRAAVLMLIVLAQPPGCGPNAHCTGAGQCVCDAGWAACDGEETDADGCECDVGSGDYKCIGVDCERCCEFNDSDFDGCVFCW